MIFLGQMAGESLDSTRRIDMIWYTRRNPELLGRFINEDAS